MNFKNYLVSATAAALIASSALSFSTLTASATNPTEKTNTAVVADNATEAVSTYSAMPFKFLTEDKSGVSQGMSRNVQPTAQIEKTADGKLFAYVTETNASIWKGFKVSVNGTMTEVETVSEEKDEANQVTKRLVKFEIASLNDVIESEISVSLGEYNKTYKVWLDFNNETVTDLAYKVWDKELVASSASLTSQVYTTAQTEIIDGKKYAYITLKNNNLWAGFKSKIAGELTEAEVVYNNDTNKTRIIKVQIPTEKELVETESHIVATYPGGVHDAKYITYFDFNNVITDEAVVNFTAYNANKTAVADTSELLNPSATVRNYNGELQALVTVKDSAVVTAIKVKVAGNFVDAKVLKESTDKTTSKKVKVLQLDVPNYKTAPVEVQVTTTKDGVDTVTTYNLDFNKLIDLQSNSSVEKKVTVLNSDQSSTSTMQQYVNGTAKVYELNGKTYAEITTSGASMWKGFQTEVNGSLAEAEIVSENGDTRVYKIDISNASSLILGKVHINVPGVYDTTHTVYLKIGEANTTVKPTTPEDDAVAGETANANKVVSTVKYNAGLLSKNKKTKSPVSAYISPQIKVQKTKSGKYYGVVTLKNASMWKSVKAQYNGKMINVTTVSTDKKNNTKTVKFQMKSAKSQVKLTYTLKTAKKGLSGNYTNYINVGSKYVAPTTVISTKKYTYKQVKSSLKTSSYVSNNIKVEKTQAGKYYATVTVKNASAVKSVKAVVNGKNITATTVSTNKKNNTKIVKFQIASPSKQVKLILNVKKGKTTKNYTSAIKLAVKK